jgi:hypothetical protein
MKPDSRSGSFTHVKWYSGTDSPWGGVDHKAVQSTGDVEEYTQSLHQACSPLLYWTILAK